MRLLRARVKGFQSFADSGDVEFSSGINLLVGQNNSGKSSFLRALHQTMQDDRHKSPERFAAYLLPTPELHLVLELEGSELLDLMLQTNAEIRVPVNSRNPPEAEQRIAEFFMSPPIPFKLTKTPSEFRLDGHQVYFDPHSTPKHNVRIIPGNGRYQIVGPEGGLADTLAILANAAWQRNMFFFAAERLSVSEFGSSHQERLSSNANNLPAVLQTLFGNRGSIFSKLIIHLREIFSTVGNLSVRPSPAQPNISEVRIWPTEEMINADLSFPLSQSGTGVAQAIAILTAIMTIDRAVVIIDEINSFLHPAAVKSLLRIIQTEYSHHQYIISTHAAEVISFSNPSTIHLISRTGYDSTVKKLNVSEVETFREVSNHLGISMSDVFATDNIVWVEGPTEELCFPYLLDALGEGVPRGCQITSVSNTGDFNRKRDAQVIFEVYKRLSTSSAPLVKSVSFSFDTEKLTDGEKQKMSVDSGGLVHFLPRRNFECYLIDPEAIAHFIQTRDIDSGISAQNVQEQIERSATGRELNVSSWNKDIRDKDWLKQVDGAGLIADVCKTLTDHRVTFSKKLDSLTLLKHIVEKNKSHLDSLIEYVRGLVAS